MKTILNKLTGKQLAYPLDQLAPLDKVLFLDIETTGFAAKSSTLYLIGCMFYENDCWNTIQWLAQSYEEEKDVLQAFLSFSSSYSFYIHFNGNNFDIPFMKQKCIQHQLSWDLDKITGIDLYKRVSLYKNLLCLPNCKQKTLEQFLGLSREDLFSGGELIGIYHDYVSSPTDLSESLLLLHNVEDIKGLFDILPVLSYYDLFNGNMKTKKVQANYYTDSNGVRRQELLMNISIKNPIPKPISGNYQGCFFTASNSQGVIKVPLYEEELKYFYAGYKDYFYLLYEDVAMHKSVAAFVDKKHRIQANATNCYTRKFSTYLPQWDVFVEPFYKRDYKSKELFFEVLDDMKKDREFFTKYARYILDYICVL